MAIDDLWVKKDGTHSKRYGRGLRYRVRVDGYKATSHRTKKEAEYVNAARISAGPPKPKTVLPVDALLDEWLAAKKELRQSSYLRCVDTAKTVRARWHGILVADIRQVQVQEWVNRLSRSDGEPMSASGKRKALAALSWCCRVAVKREAISVDPCAEVTVGRVKPREPIFLMPGQVKKLVREVPENYRPLILLLAMCGLRVGEAVALNVGDVDVDRARIRIGDSKTGRARDVALPDTVEKMLDLDRPDSDPLFLATDGQRIRVNKFRRCGWVSAKRRAGLPEDLRLHDLRHTAASLAIAAGADVKVVQRMLGHASATMTLDLYGHLLDRRLGEVADAMDELMS